MIVVEHRWTESSFFFETVLTVAKWPCCYGDPIQDQFGIVSKQQPKKVIMDLENGSLLRIWRLHFLTSTAAEPCRLALPEEELPAKTDLDSADRSHSRMRDPKPLSPS